MPDPGARPVVALVAAGFGSGLGEREVAVRRLAGALAKLAEVEVVSLEEGRPSSSPPGGGEVVLDGAFRVHPIAPFTAGRRPGGREAARARTALARAALSITAREDELLPDVVGRHLLRAEGADAAGALETLRRIAPDAVVLCGAECLGLVAGGLGGRSGCAPAGRRPRVVALPLLGSDEGLAAASLGPLASSLDAVGLLSDVELELASRSLAAAGGAPAPRLHRLHPSFPVPGDSASARPGLAGLGPFGEYLLLVTGWPDCGALPPLFLAAAAPQHELVRDVAGEVSVAEVRPGGWFVTDRRRRFDLPWPRGRANLRHLMGGALATVDLRPQGPLAELAVESMLLGTPVVVPEGSVAAERARLGNGGLWFRSTGELLGELRLLLADRALRTRLARSGLSWAEREHGDAGRFVGEVGSLVLG